MNDDHPVKDKSNKTRFGCAILVLMGITVLYILSPPFVAVLHDHLPAEAQPVLVRVAQVIYSPLNWLYLRNETVREFYDWYQGLFERI